MNKQDFTRILTAQGVDSLKLSKQLNVLAESELFKAEGDQPLSVKDIATALVAITTPCCLSIAAHAIITMNLVDESGTTFGDALRGILEAEPHQNGVARITVCQSFPWARIKYLSGNCWEFAQADFQPCAIRTEAVITGGLISALAMKLHFKTESGWTDRRLNAEGEPA